MCVCVFVRLFAQPNTMKSKEQNTNKKNNKKCHRERNEKEKKEPHSTDTRKKAKQFILVGGTKKENKSGGWLAAWLDQIRYICCGRA